ncbi:MAG: C39 family peptidase [Defluviitaleaceae bacterium]|nr:C39 family peptidase [Defluviitaleaceae bacterium]
MNKRILRKIIPMTLLVGAMFLTSVFVAIAQEPYDSDCQGDALTIEDVLSSLSSGPDWQGAQERAPLIQIEPGPVRPRGFVLDLPDDFDGGAADGRQESIEYWSNPEINELLRERMERRDEIDALLERAPRMSWFELRPFTYYAQFHNQSCGPASVRMVMHWRSGAGSVPTETQVYNWIRDLNRRNGHALTPMYGTTLIEDLRDYIAHFSGFRYVVTFPNATNMDRMARDIRGVVQILNMPSIVGIDGRALGIPRALRHYIVVSGNFQEVAFTVHDPWGGFIGDNRWSRYDVTRDDLWRAFTFNGLNTGFLW